MARRADHSRDEIKTLAIAAGSTLIQEHGYTNFSARKVAAVIGYTVGTLYNVFSDQHDFILHINGVTLEGMQQHLTTIDSTIYGAERIHALATQYLIYVSEHPALWQTIFAHVMPPERMLPDWYTQKINSLFSSLEQALIVLTPEPHAHARIIWSALHGMSLLLLTHKITTVGVQDVQALAARFIQTYLKGLSI
ncbi:MAG: TetR/AcrR family transcriptional regulator [Holosporales bacterium]|jgi:AcrR family transcriptional regulator